MDCATLYVLSLRRDHVYVYNETFFKITLLVVSGDFYCVAEIHTFPHQIFLIMPSSKVVFLLQLFGF